MRCLSFSWVCIAVLVFASSAAAFDAPRARPEEVGFAPERLAQLEERLATTVKNGELAGIVLLVARKGKVVHLSATGLADVERKTPLKTDSIFRWYSMTKPISATALMMLYEDGRFELSQPLADFIPEFNAIRVLRSPDAGLGETIAAERMPTIHDTLRHTGGFSHGIHGDALDDRFVEAGYFGLDVTLAGMMTRLAKLPLRYQPGTRWEYSVGPDIDARLVELMSGQRFDEFLEQRIFKPLGMKDTAFWLSKESAPRLASVHWLKKGKLTPLDQRHGAPEWVIADPELVNSYTVDHPRKGGSYGLVGTAEDYWRFAQMILNGGTFEGTRILGPRTVDYMLSDHLAGTNAAFTNGITFGLGFAVMTDPAAAGFIASPGSAYWAGAAATNFWIDPEEQLIIVSMTQHFKVPATDSTWNAIRTMVYGAIAR